MEYTTLSPNNDPMGAAIRDYQNKGKASRLRVLSSMFDEEKCPLPTSSAHSTKCHDWSKRP